MTEVSGEVREALRGIMSESGDFMRWEVASRDTIEVKRIYVDLAGDLAAGVLLSQIIYWYLPSKTDGLPKVRVLKDGKLWLAKGRKDWWEECRLTPDQFDRCLSILEKRGLVSRKVFKFNGNPTTHLWLNLEAVEKGTRSILPIGENDLAKTQDPTLYTETTTETTNNHLSDFSKKPSEEEEQTPSSPNHRMKDGLSLQAARDKAKDPPPVATNKKAELATLLKGVAAKHPNDFEAINQWVKGQVAARALLLSIAEALRRLNEREDVVHPVGFLRKTLGKINEQDMLVGGINGAIEKNGDEFRKKVERWEKEKRPDLAMDLVKLVTQEIGRAG